MFSQRNMCSVLLWSCLMCAIVTNSQPRCTFPTHTTRSPSISLELLPSKQIQHLYSKPRACFISTWKTISDVVTKAVKEKWHRPFILRFWRQAGEDWWWTQTSRRHKQLLTFYIFNLPFCIHIGIFTTGNTIQWNLLKIFLKSTL